MGIGGKRPGAGRKSRWRSSTKMMRLPAIYEAELNRIAHCLDQGKRLEPDSFTLDEINLAIAGVLLSIPPRDRRKANRLFQKMLKRLS
ncbi:MAG: hypothetical protein HC769_33075 [Cyanobacteria bacterium CRU_2_1]|nr:hypothetical protein [Cyanobacteria bacterium CRU_2_1]